jgi:hypothetical protein
MARDFDAGELSEMHGDHEDGGMGQSPHYFPTGEAYDESASFYLRGEYGGDDVETTARYDEAREAADRCLAHLGERCPTDVRLFGTADHCDDFLTVPFRGRYSSADCYFGDGSGLAEQRRSR